MFITGTKSFFRILMLPVVGFLLKINISPVHPVQIRAYLGGGQPCWRECQQFRCKYLMRKNSPTYFWLIIVGFRARRLNKLPSNAWGVGRLGRVEGGRGSGICGWGGVEAGWIWWRADKLPRFLSSTSLYRGKRSRHNIIFHSSQQNGAH